MTFAQDPKPYEAPAAEEIETQTGLAEAVAGADNVTED
jgi:hypothetical protein